MANNMNLVIQISANGSQATAQIVGLGNAVQGASSNLQAMQNQANATSQAVNVIGGMARTAITALGGLAAVGGFVSTITETEKLRGSLETVTGSINQAGQAFAALENFAATTPFTLDQSVQAFIRMKALGLNPTESAMTSFGNTAAAMGADMMQYVEAVADASTGEFERLKEFGIKAAKEGENVALTFQGVTTKVGNNAEEITAYLEKIGNTNFAGAMEKQMQRLPGVISNLQDNVAGLFRALGDAGATSALTDGLRAVSDVIGGLKDAVSTGWAFDILTTEAQIWFDAISYGSEGAGTALDGVKFAIGEVGSFIELYLIDAWELVSTAALDFSANAVAAVKIIMLETLSVAASIEGAWGSTYGVASEFFLKLANAGVNAFLTIKLAASEAVDWIIKQLGSAVGSFSGLADLPGLPPEFAASIRGAEASIKSYAGAQASVRSEITQSNAAHQQAIGAIQAERNARVSAAAANKASAKQGIDDALAARDASIANASATRATSKEFHEAQVAENKLRAGLNDLAGAHTKAGAAAEEQAKGLGKTKAATKDAGDEIDRLMRKYNGSYKEMAEYQDTQADLNKLYRAGAISLGEYTDALNDHLNKQAGMDGAMRTTAQATKDTATAMKAEADPYAEAWVHAIERVDSAFADAWTGAFDSFGDFASKIKDAFLGLLGELAHAAITRPIMVSLGLGGAGTASAGQAGGSITGALGGTGGITDMLGLGGLASGIQTAIGAVSGFSTSLFGGAGLAQSAMLAAQTAEFGLAGATATGSALGMSSLGSMAAAAAPFAAAAVLALPIVNNLIRKSETTAAGLKGSVSSAGFAGSWFNTNTKSGGLWGNGSSTDSHGLNGDEQASLDRQVQAVYDAMAGLGEAVGLGVDKIYEYTAEFSADTLNKGQEGIDAALGSLGEELAGQYSAVFADLGTELGDAFAGVEINSQNLIQTLQEFSVLDSIIQSSGITDLEANIGALVAGTSEYSRAGESAAQTALRMAGSLDTANTIMDGLGMAAFDTTMAGANMASSLADSFGGIDAMAQASAGYYETFYSAAERSNNAVESMTARFDELGVSMPASTEALRAMVEAQDLSTEAGRETFAGLVQISSGFADLMGTITAQIGLTADGIKGIFSNVLANATSVDDARAQAMAGAEQMLMDGMVNMMLDQVTQTVMAGIVQPMAMGLVGAAAQSAAIDVSASGVAASNLVMGGGVAAQNIAMGGAAGASNLASGGAAAGGMVAEGGAIAGNSLAGIVDQAINTINTMTQIMASADFQAAMAEFSAAIGDIGAALYTGQESYSGSVTAYTNDGIGSSGSSSGSSGAGETAAPVDPNIDIIKRLTEEQASLQIDMLRAEGNEVEALARERAAAIDGMNAEAVALYDANQATRDQIQTLRDEAEAREKAAREAQDLGMRILELSDSEAYLAATRAQQLAALDESNRALQEQVWALEAQAQAAEEAAEAQRKLDDERSGLTLRLLELTDSEAFLNATREKELAALDESNRALQEQIWALEAQAKAADIVNGLMEDLATRGMSELEKSMYDVDKQAAEYMQQLQDLGQLTDSNRAAVEQWQSALKEQARLEYELAAAREAVTQALDAEIASLEAQRQAFENDMQRAAGMLDRAKSAELERISGEEAGRIAALQSEINALGEVSSAASDANAAIKSMVDTLKNAASDLRQTEGTQAARYANARAELDSMIAGRGAGVNEASVDRVTSGLSNNSADNYASAFEFERSQLVAANKLDELAGMVAGQMTFEDASLGNQKAQTDALNAQIEAIKTESEARRDEVEAQAKAAQERLDAMNGVDNSVVTMDEAIREIARLDDKWQDDQSRKIDDQITLAKQYAEDEILRFELAYQAQLSALFYSQSALYYSQATLGAISNVAVGVSSAVEVLVDIAKASGAPGYAKGGLHSGGWRIVGENGPELEATGPSRIYSAEDTRRILSGGRHSGGDGGAADEIRALREENRAQAQAVVSLNKRIAKILERWDATGQPETRVETAV